MFTKSSYPNLYVHTSLEPIEATQERYNIILSPSLYWVKKLSLPIKYTREVKKLLPSIFEDMLLDGEYSYFVYKKESEYLAFAYEDKAILSLLEKKGLHAHNIAKVYFAQSIFESMEHAIAVDAAMALVNKEGIVVELPLLWLKETQPLDLSICTLEHPITLATFTHIIEPKVFTRLSAGVLIFALLFLLQTFLLHRQSAILERQKAKLYEEFSLKPTSMQNSALLKKYSSLYEKQTSLREKSAQILSLKLPTHSSLIRIKLEDEKLFAEFSTKDAKALHALLRPLKLTYTTKDEAEKITIEVAL